MRIPVRIPMRILTGNLFRNFTRYLGGCRSKLLQRHPADGWSVVELFALATTEIPTFNHHLIIPTMISFWILWIFNALMSLIPIYFFFIGLADGSVDSDNMGIWMILLAVVALIMGGTYWLKTQNQIKAAKVVLIIAAIPSVLAIIFMSVAIFGDVRWN